MGIFWAQHHVEAQPDSTATINTRPQIDSIIKVLGINLNPIHLSI